MNSSPPNSGGTLPPSPVITTTVKHKHQNQQATSPAQEVRLQRTLGLRNGVSMIVGVIVGSGIFITPKGVLQQSGSIGASLVVWSLCGLLALLGALCFAELGTSIPNSGGEYTYIRLAYGPLASYLYLWVTVFVIMPCGNAVAALTFANYVLQPLYPIGCEPPESAIRLMALAIIILLIYINCASIKSSIQLQNSFTLAKILALALIIAYGFYYLITNHAMGRLNPSRSIWDGTEASVSKMAQAFYAGFYTYAGWNSLNCATEEMKEPVKNMPRAIILSITAVTLIYILTNVAYFAVLTKPDIANSDAIAVIFGQRALGYASWLMPVAVALSTVGGLNGNIFAASRVLLAGARQGQLFSALNMIHYNHLTPIPSLLCLGLVSCLYLITTEILSLINYVVFVEATFAALGVSTVLTLRYKLPQIHRPLKIYTIVPLVYLLFSFLLIVLPIWSSPIEATIGLFIVLTGVPAYYLTAHWKVKPAGYQKVLDEFNLLTQKLTLSVTPTSDVQHLL